MGVYRGALRIWEDGEPVKEVEAVFGLTEAELRRGTDSQIDLIQQQVLQSGQPRLVCHIVARRLSRLSFQMRNRCSLKIR